MNRVIWKLKVFPQETSWNANFLGIFGDFLGIFGDSVWRNEVWDVSELLFGGMRLWNSCGCCNVSVRLTPVSVAKNHLFVGMML